MGIQVIKSGGGVAGLNLAGGVALSASLTSVVDAFANVTPLQLATASIGLNAPTFLTVPTWTNTLGSKDGFYSQQTVAVASAGTGVFRMIRNSYTINNTAAQTGSITGYFLNATETALNGMKNVLMDLQINNISVFKIDPAGAGITANGMNANFLSTQITSTGYFGFSTRALIYSPSDGILRFNNYAGTDFNRLQLGGTTSSFPAIKRNGAAIDFRLADDSAVCNINTGSIFAGTGATFDIGSASQSYLNLFVNLSQRVGSPFKLIWYSNNLAVGSPDTSISRYSANVVRIGNETTGAGNLFVGGSTGYDSTAILQADSTTKGFLMPRMTQAQILLILLPAAGLMVYNTDIQAPCFYDGTALRWEKISHSVM